VLASKDEVLEMLYAQAQIERVEGMARYGMTSQGRLGVKMPEIRKIARQVGKDHRLALELWDTGLAEARILASMLAEPEQLTGVQMETWVVDFNSWDVCDQVCMNLFEKSPLAWEKIHAWSIREEQYVKRGAFALIACLAWHDKGAQDEDFIGLLPVIQRGADDERNYVKKAVNWALRNIGKRDLALNQAAIQAAQQIGQIDSKAARWIAADALRELQGEKVQRRLRI
jgi:3-methyladenine DNA glycosylase AlkD